MTHTKEPWKLRGNEIGKTIISDDQNHGMMQSIAFVDKYDFEDAWDANASRIVACVNALEGLSNDALEGGWNFKEMSAYTKSLEDKAKWNLISENMPPVNVWLEFYDGDKTINDTLLHNIDKIDKHGDMAVNYLHNYTHWRELRAPA